MPFTAFAKTVKTVKTVEIVKPTKTAKPAVLSATVMLNGPKSFVFHLPVSTCDALGLVVGDRLRFFFDDKTGQMAFLKDNKKGDHVLAPHGANPNRLKTPFTRFMRDNGIEFESGEMKVQGPLTRCHKKGMYSMFLCRIED